MRKVILFIWFFFLGHIDSVHYLSKWHTSYFHENGAPSKVGYDRGRGFMEQTGGISVLWVNLSKVFVELLLKFCDYFWLYMLITLRELIFAETWFFFCNFYLSAPSKKSSLEIIERWSSWKSSIVQTCHQYFVGNKLANTWTTSQVHDHY